jgi:hypothetical protein
MTGRTCTRPGCAHVRAKGSPRYCIEDWLTKQPVLVQVRYAEERLTAVPLSLRLARVPERHWPAGRRWCAGCQSFVRLIDCAKGASRCKACSSVAAHRRHVEATYGITAADYARLYAAQGGKCYICRRKAHSKRLAVDHDHETGEVRGLLCADRERGCNFALVGNIRGANLHERRMMALRLVSYIIDPPARRILGA